MVCSVKVQRRAVWWRRALWRRGGGGDVDWGFLHCVLTGQEDKARRFWMA